MTETTNNATAENTTETTERDLNSMRYGWRTRRMLQSEADFGPGMWNVSIATYEQYESTTYNPVGLFNTLDEADAYCDAYDAALEEAREHEVGQYESSGTHIEFIPFAPDIPAKFHNVYMVTTSRNEETGEREIEEVSAIRYTEDEFQKIPSDEGDLLNYLIANPDKAVFEFEYEYVEGAGSVRVPGQEIKTSDVFPELKKVEYETWDGDRGDYAETTERFVTLNPKNVVLKP